MRPRNPRNHLAEPWPWWISDSTMPGGIRLRVLLYSYTGKKPDLGPDVRGTIYPASRETVSAQRRRLEDRIRKNWVDLDAALSALGLHILKEEEDT